MPYIEYRLTSNRRIFSPALVMRLYVYIGTPLFNHLLSIRLISERYPNHNIRISNQIDWDLDRSVINGCPVIYPWFFRRPYHTTRLFINAHGVQLIDTKTAEKKEKASAAMLSAMPKSKSTPLHLQNKPQEYFYMNSFRSVVPQNTPPGILHFVSEPDRILLSRYKDILPIMQQIQSGFSTYQPHELVLNLSLSKDYLNPDWNSDYPVLDEVDRTSFSWISAQQDPRPCKDTTKRYYLGVTTGRLIESLKYCEMHSTEHPTQQQEESGSRNESVFLSSVEYFDMIHIEHGETDLFYVLTVLKNAGFHHTDYLVNACRGYDTRKICRVTPWLFQIRNYLQPEIVAHKKMLKGVYEDMLKRIQNDIEYRRLKYSMHAGFSGTPEAAEIAIDEFPQIRYLHTQQAEYNKLLKEVTSNLARIELYVEINAELGGSIPGAVAFAEKLFDKLRQIQKSLPLYQVYFDYIDLYFARQYANAKIWNIFNVFIPNLEKPEVLELIAKRLQYIKHSVEWLDDFKKALARWMHEVQELINEAERRNPQLGKLAKDCLYQYSIIHEDIVNILHDGTFGVFK